MRMVSRKACHRFYNKLIQSYNIAEIINLQPLTLKDGRAKVYQVKQVRGIILKYTLHKESEDV